MLFEALPELSAAVSLTALREEVHHADPRPQDPVRAPAAVDEPEHLHLVEVALFLGPLRDACDGVPLSFGDGCGGDLDPVYPEGTEQRLGDAHLFRGGERDVARLLTVPEGRVEQLDRVGLIHRVMRQSRCLEPILLP
jgi:hypothetical protein